MRTHTPTHMHTHKHMHAHTLIHTSVDRDVCTHTQTHTHKHTHLHVMVCSQSIYGLEMHPRFNVVIFSVHYANIILYSKAPEQSWTKTLDKPWIGIAVQFLELQPLSSLSSSLSVSARTTLPLN